MICESSKAIFALALSQKYLIPRHRYTAKTTPVFQHLTILFPIHHHTSCSTFNAEFNPPPQTSSCRGCRTHGFDQVIRPSWYFYFVIYLQIIVCNIQFQTDILSKLNTYLHSTFSTPLTYNLREFIILSDCLRYTYLIHCK